MAKPSDIFGNLVRFRQDTAFVGAPDIPGGPPSRPRARGVSNKYQAAFVKFREVGNPRQRARLIWDEMVRLEKAVSNPQDLTGYFRVGVDELSEATSKAGIDIRDIFRSGGPNASEIPPGPGGLNVNPLKPFTRNPFPKMTEAYRGRLLWVLEQNHASVVDTLAFYAGPGGLNQNKVDPLKAIRKFADDPKARSHTANLRALRALEAGDPVASLLEHKRAGVLALDKPNFEAEKAINTQLEKYRERGVRWNVAEGETAQDYTTLTDDQKKRLRGLKKPTEFVTERRQTTADFDPESAVREDYRRGSRYAFKGGSKFSPQQGRQLSYLREMLGGLHEERRLLADIERVPKTVVNPTRLQALRNNVSAMESLQRNQGKVRDMIMKGKVAKIGDLASDAANPRFVKQLIMGLLEIGRKVK